MGKKQEIGKFWGKNCECFGERGHLAAATHARCIPVESIPNLGYFLAFLRLMPAP